MGGASIWERGRSCDLLLDTHDHWICGTSELCVHTGRLTYFFFQSLSCTWVSGVFARIALLIENENLKNPFTCVCSELVGRASGRTTPSCRSH